MLAVRLRALDDLALALDRGVRGLEDLADLLAGAPAPSVSSSSACFSSGASSKRSLRARYDAAGRPASGAEMSALRELDEAGEQGEPALDQAMARRIVVIVE